jgi:hypothetical protein
MACSGINAAFLHKKAERPPVSVRGRRGMLARHLADRRLPFLTWPARRWRDTLPLPNQSAQHFARRHQIVENLTAPERVLHHAIALAGRGAI